jgi:uncharacterized SAM-binding protein YcdF (DUF218 family)
VSASRRVVRAVAAVVGVVVLYVALTATQVVWAAHRDSRRAADVIVVLGAAQYDGRPSPVLTARLSHAVELWRQGLAPRIAVTGGKQQGDRFTEAAAAARYLLDRGVPDGAIVREVQGRTSWQSLSAVAAIARPRGWRRVLLVSDGYHAKRIEGMARELGLDATVSPSAGGSSAAALAVHEAKETLGVALARFIGYRRLQWIDR